MRKTLIFAYNADSGILNSLSDSLHKFFSPSTYLCNLCKITYGSLGMKKEWRRFLDSLECNLEFLHRNELSKAYRVEDVGLPAILLRHNSHNKPTLLVSADQINAVSELESLKTLIREAVGRSQR